ncbi:trypsin-like serine protease [Quadrisphaera sp. KR29]|uniref:trypsin-like serine protease n=1 Tax=Quadrisphaera sp. KR29 TaxID=3461391 RepID=UPI0040450012
MTGPVWPTSQRRRGPGRLAASLLALLLLVTGLVAVSSQQPASAITGGEADGERHPAVALIVFYDGTGGRYRCTATLVAPRVLLTAAHCTDGVVGEVAVTFRSTVAESAPAPFPEVTDPQGGFTGTEKEEGWLYGTPSTHPDYSDFTDLDSWNDVGVVVLDTPVEGIAPQRIAPVGTLDALAQPVLTKTAFTFVGYGTEVRKPVSGPQKPQPMGYPLLRRTTTSPGQKLTPQVLQVNGNPNDPRGGGGTCSGDSGGPGYYQGVVVTVTSYGYTENCRYLGGNQRVDIPVVQQWLARFGVRA